MAIYDTSNVTTVWTTWVGNGTNAVTPGAWPYWIANTAGTNATTTDNVWRTWLTTETNSATTMYRTVFPSVAPRARTDEEIAADAQRQAEARERARRAEAERVAAKAKAKELLERHLSEEQRKELAANRYFTVITRDGERVYRIHEGRSGNVRRVNAKGERMRTYCIHPSDLVPDEDTMLAQKLMLETAEEDFLRIANAS